MYVPDLWWVLSMNSCVLMMCFPYLELKNNAIDIHFSMLYEWRLYNVECCLYWFMNFFYKTETLKQLTKYSRFRKFSSLLLTVTFIYCLTRTEWPHTMFSLEYFENSVCSEINKTLPHGKGQKGSGGLQNRDLLALLGTMIFQCNHLEVMCFTSRFLGVFFMLFFPQMKRSAK